MDNQSQIPPLDFRKKITNQFQLTQINVLSEQWGISHCDVCWRLITAGIVKEKEKREEIEQIKKQNKNQ
jgi:hypothetical protein